MSLNPISKIVYYTPHKNPETGLSELFEILGAKVQSKRGKERIELITDSENAKLQVQFKNGSKREIGIDFLRNIKHAVEGVLLEEDESASEEDFDALTTMAM